MENKHLYMVLLHEDGNDQSDLRTRCRGHTLVGTSNDTDEFVIVV